MRNDARANVGPRACRSPLGADIEPLRRRYYTDARFHALVFALRQEIAAGRLTVADLTDASALLAREAVMYPDAVFIAIQPDAG